MLSLPYTVDTQAPAVQLSVTKLATGYRIRANQIGSGKKDADRVEVSLPDGSVLALTQKTWGKFEGVWETTALASPVTLRVVVRDRALNQATQELVIQ